MTTTIFRSILPSEDNDELSDDTTDESDENTEEKP